LLFYDLFLSFVNNFFVFIIHFIKIATAPAEPRSIFLSHAAPNGLAGIATPTNQSFCLARIAGTPATGSHLGLTRISALWKSKWLPRGQKGYQGQDQTRQLDQPERCGHPWRADAIFHKKCGIDFTISNRFPITSLSLRLPNRSNLLVL
jgi:hypothetical protein